jgi:hypothetical protein
MTRATARRLATSWKAWAWLPLAVAVIVVEGLIVAGLLSREGTAFVVGGALVVTNGGRVFNYGKRLRAKALSR